MKAGKTLVELAQEITRRADAKKDFIVPTQSLTMGDVSSMLLFADQAVAPNPHTHGQIAAHTGIPKTYYDKMLADQPQLLANNVNTWFKANPATRMVRTLDNKARAFLSDRYRPLENEELAEAVLPVLMDLGVTVMSSEITDRRLYIKAVDEKVERSVPKGKRIGDGSHTIFETDELCPAIVISNSEVGAGMLSVQTSLFTRACTNLAIFNERSIRKHHVGTKHDIVDGLYHLLSEETRRVSDKALWMQVKDVVRNSFDKARFDALVDKVTGLAEQKIDGDVVKVVDLAARKFGTNETEKKSILRHLIEGGDLSRYGLFNAVTRTAEDQVDYDRATELESLGGMIVDLPVAEWKEMALAA
jgi:hypothetical protein